MPNVESIPQPSSHPAYSTYIGAQYIYGSARVFNGTHINQSSTSANEERIAVLNWLSPLNAAETHHRIRELTPIQSSDIRSISGDCTGKWLLESDVFDDWRSRTISHLWYHGIPGAGKTVLASIIIEHMRQLASSLRPGPNVGKVAYLYLQYGKRPPIHELVGSIVRQLVEDDEQLPEVVLQQYNTHARNGETKATETLLSSLLCELASQRPVYIVLDALDEYRCGSTEEEDESICKRLLKYIVPDGAEKGSISILITSRLLDEFTDLSKNFHRVNIGANERDIAIFVDHEFDDKSRLQEFAEMDSGIRDLVKETITRDCGGMFLLARLHMKALSDQRTLRSFKDQLRNLPKDIDKTYDAIVVRLNQLPAESKRNLAWNTIGWIVLSRRHLTTSELQHVLACTRETTTLDSEDMPNLDDVQELCGGLITYVNNTVTLIHHTAQSYFESRAQEHFANFHDTIAQACLRYLGFFSLSLAPHSGTVVRIATSGYNQHSTHRNRQRGIVFVPSETSLYAVLDLFSFVRYAISFLTYHLDRQTTDQSRRATMKMMIELLDNQGNRYFLCYVLKELKLYPTKIKRLHDLGLRRSSLDSTSSQGDDDPQAFHHTYIDEQEEDIMTEADGERLQEEGTKSAAATEDDSHFGCLLDEVERTYSTSSLSETLAGSYRNDNEDVDSTTHDQNLQADLMSAAFASLESRMSLRGVTLNIDPGSPDEGQEFHIEAMLWAIMEKLGRSSSPTSRYSQSLQDRLEYRTEFAGEDWSKVSSLHLAACIGYTPLVVHIAQLSDDVNATDSQGLNPLYVATQKGNFEAMEVILSHGDAFIDFSTTEGHDILLHLAQNERSDLIERVFSEVLSPLLFDNVPSLLQIFSFIIAKVILLLFGIKMNWRLWTPHPVKHQPHCALSDLQLLDAAYRGNLTVIKELIENKRVYLDSKIAFTSTAVFLAVSFHRVGIVEYLLDHGADPNIPGSRGMRPLHLATRSNNVAMVELLLEKGADVEATDDDGLPAWLASLNMANSRELITIFVKAGADLNKIDSSCAPKLYWASCAGDINLVQFLLDHGADPSRRTSYLWAPLHFAAHNGRLDCVLALLSAGAELSPMSDQSRTPLDMAIQGKQGYIAKLLRERGAKTAEEIYTERGTHSSWVDVFESPTASPGSSAQGLTTSLFPPTPPSPIRIRHYGSDSEDNDDAENSDNDDEESNDNDYGENNDSDDGENDEPRLVDSFFLLLRNWDKIVFSDQQVMEDILNFLRRDIEEVLICFIEDDYEELDRVTEEDRTRWNELIVGL